MIIFQKEPSGSHDQFNLILVTLVICFSYEMARAKDMLAYVFKRKKNLLLLLGLTRYFSLTTSISLTRWKVYLDTDLENLVISPWIRQLFSLITFVSLTRLNKSAWINIHHPGNITKINRGGGGNILLGHQ